MNNVHMAYLSILPAVFVCKLRKLIKHKQDQHSNLLNLYCESCLNKTASK